MEPAVVSHFLAKITPGGVGIWALVALCLMAWWKGLPAVIEVIANRQSAIEQRMGILLEQTTERFMRQLEEADHRHEECMRGQESLRERIVVLERDLRDANQHIAGLNRQLAAMQISTVRVTPSMQPSQDIVDMMDRLDKIDYKRSGGGKQ